MCSVLERTSGAVLQLIHSHWDIKYKSLLQYALVACRTITEAESMWVVRKDARVGLTRHRRKGWHKVYD